MSLNSAKIRRDNSDKGMLKGSMLRFTKFHQQLVSFMVLNISCELLEQSYLWFQIPMNNTLKMAK